MNYHNDEPEGLPESRVLRIPEGPLHPCPYLPDRMAREQVFYTHFLPPGYYHRLMDRGWRRSGWVFYTPVCAPCQECRPIRIPVGTFQPNRSQRRNLKLNADLRAELGDLEPSQEKFALFRRYQEGRHGGDMCRTYGEFEEFLYQSPIKSRELRFTLNGAFKGAAILDFDGDAVSAVYTYYDPDEEHRGLGVWAILQTLALARNLGVPYYYLGFHVADCRKMNYKNRFRPCEILDPPGVWRKVEDRPQGICAQEME